MSQVRISTICRSIEERRWLEATYSRPGEGDEVVTRTRKLFASHVYEAANGNLCVVAYDTAHKEVRTFRLDRFDSLRLGKAAPEPKAIRGKTLMYPASWNVRRAKPMLVTDSKAGDYIIAGWMPTPQAMVLRQLS